MIEQIEIKTHLEDFNVSHPVLIEQTALANVMSVRRENGSKAVLKVWHRPGTEQGGIDYLLGSDASATVTVIKRSATALLMEQLDGPALSTVVTEKGDTLATEILARVGVELLGNTNKNSHILRPLDQQLAALFEASFGPECQPSLKDNVRHARDLASFLLKTQTTQVALHGDLHHDNILRHKGRWIAIDPKGLMGEPLFEFANAFRNPKGFNSLMREEETILRRASAFSAALQASQKRMLQWAAVKTALSISWRSEGQIVSDPEDDLLSTLLYLADQ